MRKWEDWNKEEIKMHFASMDTQCEWTQEYYQVEHAKWEDHQKEEKVGHDESGKQSRKRFAEIKMDCE